MISDREFEELGFVAEKKGFFSQWQNTMNAMIKEKNILSKEAGFFAFEELSH